jgi:hypothetical protein
MPKRRVSHGVFASRKTACATMFAIWPPLTKTPSVVAGRPSSSAIHRRVCTSIAVADGATRHRPVFWFIAAAAKVPSTETGAGAPMM